MQQRTFQLQQFLLRWQTARVTHKTTIAADDAVARDDDRVGIGPVRRGHRTDGRRLSDLLGKCCVSRRGAERDPEQRVPHPVLKVRSHQTKWHIEHRTLALEVGIQLLLRMLDHGRCSIHVDRTQTALNACINSSTHLPITPVAQAKLVAVGAKQQFTKGCLERGDEHFHHTKGTRASVPKLTGPHHLTYTPFHRIMRNSRPMRFLSFLFAAFFALATTAQDPCDATLSIVLPTCPDDADGIISIATGAGGPFSFDWSHDFTLNAPVATGLISGPYTVVVTGVDGCVSYFDTIVEVPTVPALGQMTTTNISCAGLSDGSVTFSVNPGPYTWEWVDDASLTDATREDLGAGSYNVVVNGGECPSYISALLGDPDIFILGPLEYCPSAPPLLTTVNDFGFQPDVYLWSTGHVTSEIIVPPGTEGTVGITAVNSATGCVATDEVELVLLPSPTVTFTRVDSVCIFVPSTASLETSDADSLVWRWGTSGFSNAEDPVVTFDQPFWQPISLQGFDAFGCGSLPVMDSVFVRPRIPATYTAAQIPCTAFLQLDLASGSDSCAFFVGDSLYFHDCRGSIQLDLRRYTEYDLTFYSTQPNRCDDTASVHIDLRIEPTLFLPTAFTPDGDGLNETWPGPVDIPENGYELQLFDRWGTQLWASRDTQEKWDGAEVPSGVYIYTMRMRDPCEPTNEVAKKGMVTIVR